jgi:hypothetical protein
MPGLHVCESERMQRRHFRRYALHGDFMIEILSEWWSAKDIALRLGTPS